MKLFNYISKIINRIDFSLIAGIGVIAVCIYLVCCIEGCKKRSFERVVGHRIGWVDYFVVR